MQESWEIMSTCNCPVHPEDAKAEVVLAYDKKKDEYATFLRFDDYRTDYGNYFNVSLLGRDKAYRQAVDNYADRIYVELSRVTPIAVFK